MFLVCHAMTTKMLSACFTSLKLIKRFTLSSYWRIHVSCISNAIFFQAGKLVSMLQVLELEDDMSLSDDVELYSKTIDDKLSSKCFYDGVMGTSEIYCF